MHQSPDILGPTINRVPFYSSIGLDNILSKDVGDAPPRPRVAATTMDTAAPRMDPVSSICSRSRRES
jgi:hypothetical protein